MACHVPCKFERSSAPREDSLCVVRVVIRTDQEANRRRRTSHVARMNSAQPHFLRARYGEFNEPKRPSRLQGRQTRKRFKLGISPKTTWKYTFPSATDWVNREQSILHAIFVGCPATWRRGAVAPFHSVTPSATASIAHSGQSFIGLITSDCLSVGQRTSSFLEVVRRHVYMPR
jgi:hypothetical protein